MIASIGPSCFVLLSCAVHSNVSIVMLVLTINGYKCRIPPQVNSNVAAAMAVKQPKVLLAPADKIKPRLQHLASLLQVPEKTAAGLVQDQPGLLTHKEEILQGRLVGMAQLLGAATLEEAAALCKREPGLLAFTTEDLQSKLENLAAALSSPGDVRPSAQLVRLAPTILLLSPYTISAQVAAIASLLQLPAHAAGDLVLKTPRLLTQQPRAMSENLKGLAAELGIARESASVLCTQQPSLLILSNNMLKQRIMSLANAMDVPPAKVKELVAQKPGLLTKDIVAVKKALEAARKSGDLPPKQ